MINPNSTFVDTSGWVSFLVPKERFHADAKQILQMAAKSYRQPNSQPTVITTNYILSEVIALISSRPESRHLRSKSIEYVFTIQQTPYVQIIHVEQQVDLEAWARLRKFHDKEWSHVDASSFVLMERLNLRKALTSDHHFEQAGFERLLK